MPSKRKAKSRSSSEASSSSNKKSKIPVEADLTYGANRKIKQRLHKPKVLDQIHPACIANHVIAQIDKALQLLISYFELNPGAKVFCPSFSNHRSVTPPAVPTDFPVVPIVSAQQEAKTSQFVPRSSLPVKVVPYGNLIAGIGIIDTQYSQSIIGHVGSTAQSHRYAGQHHSIQAGPTYMHPSFPNVMVG
ncbi:hypothetical protein Acr_03g0001290 [Actinidia rufa]|uniref:Uncharacterized protein n=1 Tax=Actinidia rufa TaxID=165716 RepID=A0A7J0EAD0_9ERIC|nr:hypothetical protein Acr_03g0001290 [Actinidia rufa]